MIASINFFVLILSTLGMHVLYLMSVRPAALERRIGEKAYSLCGRYRLICSVLMGVITVNYVLYHWYPLPWDPFSSTFGWPYWVSVLIAVLIAIPSGSLMLRATLDAGEEALKPDKNHKMYQGIYKRIRHPMAAGELPLWWVIAFLVHSPFLVVYSIIYIPIFVWWCFAEEKDLLLRYGEPYREYQEHTGMFFPRRGLSNQEDIS